MVEVRIIGTKEAILPQIGEQEQGDGDLTVTGYVQPYIDEAIVLVERRNGPRSGIEYIVWRVNLHGMNLHSGHYTMDREDALRVFAYRIGARPE